MKGRKYIIYGILALLFLTPGLLSLFLYMTSDSVSGTDKSVSLEMIDKSGRVFTFESTDDMSMLFHDIVDDIKKTPHNGDLGGFTEEDAYKITLVQSGKKTSYDFFFDRTSPSSCLFRDEAGNMYVIKAAKAIEFMDSIYAASLYPHSKTPDLQINGLSAKPSESQWGYYSYSSVRHSVESETSSQPASVTTSFLDFKMSFEKAPDSIHIEVVDSLGIVFFSGNYNDFVMQGLFSGITDSNLYKCTVKAVWNDIGSDCCGSATYNFNLSVDFDPSGIFWLNADTVECGGFVVISGKNVINKDSVKVSAIPSLGYEPVFYEDGEYIRALIPINIHNGKEEIIYQIKVEYDGTSSDLTLKTSPSKASGNTKSFGSGKMDVSLRSEATLKEFADFVTSGKYETTIYQNSFFVPPNPNTVRATFGDTVKNTSSNSNNFTSGGVAHVVYSRDAIQACMSGMVVKVGVTKYGGNTVVIDHGLGLRSVYYCVKEVVVTEGSIVQAGDVVAKGCGSKGYTDGVTVYTELWVGDIPVSYRSLSEEGVCFGIDYGTEPPVNTEK